MQGNLSREASAKTGKSHSNFLNLKKKTYLRKYNINDKIENNIHTY